MKLRFREIPALESAPPQISYDPPPLHKNQTCPMDLSPNPASCNSESYNPGPGGTNRTAGMVQK